MSTLGVSFRAWVSKQTILGVSPCWQDDYRATFALETATAYVTFLPYKQGDEVLELRIQRSPKARPAFLTHFILNDEWHAKALFREMAEALKIQHGHGTNKVLVCHPQGEPPDDATSAYIESLNKEAQVLSIAFDFMPIGLADALAYKDDCAAIMLMPAVSAHQKHMHETHYKPVVVSLPASIIDRNDARRGIRLMIEALNEVESVTPDAPTVPPMRLPKLAPKVLLINVMYCDRCARIGWRIYKGLKIAAQGKVLKTTLSMKDLNDLLDTLFLYGTCLSEIKIMGILVPGVVNYCSMNLPSLGDRDCNIVEKLEKTYGTPVFMENNTNAAAMGCYILQDEFESVSLYRHQLGHMNGGQGTVIAGRLVSGRYGMAGEPKFYQRKFLYEHCYSEEIWTEKGISCICKNVLLATIGTIEPDALFVAVSTMEDVDELRSCLERTLPKYCMPELFLVDNYRDRMYLGGAALALKRLA